jgi:hypothetical protein
MAIDDAFALNGLDGTEIAAIDKSGNMDLAGTVSGVNINAVGHNVETLAANKTLTGADATFQHLDPGGAGRDVTLPAEATSGGRSFRILNTADAAEDLTVKDDGASTIVTISQNEAAWLICDGTSWVHSGIETIALS